MLIPSTLASGSEFTISSTQNTSSPRNHPPPVRMPRSSGSTPTYISHLDYVNDAGKPRGTIIELRRRPHHLRETPVSEPPHFLQKFQKTVEDLDLEKMIGIPDIYVKRQFYSTPELDRATNSSYEDYDKEILLPGDEMEHVLTCVYSDIPTELNLPEVIRYYITPVNDIADLVVTRAKDIAESTKRSNHVVFFIVSFVGKTRMKSMMTKRAAVENYFKNRANIKTYLALWNIK